MTSTPTVPGAPKSLARATAVMTAGTVLSRVTGVIRLAIVVAVLGITETRLMDTYNLASALPTMIYELVLGGVTASVFVPLFVELIEKEDRERAWEVMSAILNISLLVLTLIAVVGVLAAPWIARFYATRLQGAELLLQQRVLTFLLALFIPQVVLYGLYSILAALLNSYKRFGPPMYTPILNNLVLIAVFVFFDRAFGTVTLETVSRTQLLIIGLGTTVSVAPMGLGLLPYVKRFVRYRLTFKADHPSVRTLARLSVFVVGFVLANQVGYLVIQWLANEEQGAYSAFVSAFTLFLLPVGLFVWSLTSALTPTLSEQAVNRRWDDYRDQLSVGLRATIFVMLPAAVGYLILGRPIVRILLQHGIVTDVSTDVVADVLRLLILGLVQFSIFQLFVRAFYAMQDTKTPFLINSLVVLVNTAINVPMFAWAGVQGLAAGQAAAYTFGVLIQAYFLSKRVNGLNASRMLRPALKMFAASLAMGAGVWVAWRWLEAVLPGDLIGTTVAMGTAVVLGIASYLAFAHLLRIEELQYVRGLFTRA